MTKKETLQKEREQEIEKIVYLFNSLKSEHGKKTVFTLLRNCSKSGMSRSISIKVIYDDRLLTLDYGVSKIIGSQLDKKNGGVKIRGCGMDMGFALVNDLMYFLGFDNWQNQFRQEWI